LFKRNVVIIGTTAVLLVILTGLALAQFANKSEVDSALWRKRLKPATTSSTDWQSVPGLSHQLICTVSGLTATASLDLQGAQDGVEVGLLVDPPVQQQPPTPDAGTPDVQPTYFIDTGTTPSDRDTRTVNFGRKVGRGGHEVSLQWRSVSGSEVTLNSGTLILNYREMDGCG
jgi:hypothetical protein